MKRISSREIFHRSGLTFLVFSLVSTASAFANFGGVGVASVQQRTPKRPVAARKIASEPDRSRLIQALQENDVVLARKLISEIPELQSAENGDSLAD